METNNLKVYEVGTKILEAIIYYKSCVKTQEEHINKPIYQDFFNIRHKAAHDKEIFLKCIARLQERFIKNQAKIKF